MSIDKKKVLSNTFSKKLLSRQETAELLGVSSGTLAVWLCCKRYDLPYIKVGRLVKYILNFMKMAIIMMKNYRNIMILLNSEVFWTAIASISAVIGLVIAYRQSHNKGRDFEVSISGYTMVVDVDKVGCKYIDIHFRITNPFGFDYTLHEIQILYDGYWFTSSGNINTETYYVSKPILNHSDLIYTIKMSSTDDLEWKKDLDKDGWSGAAGMLNKTMVVKTDRKEYIFEINKFNKRTLKNIIKLLNNTEYHHQI